MGTFLLLIGNIKARQTPTIVGKTNIKGSFSPPTAADIITGTKTPAVAQIKKTFIFQKDVTCLLPVLLVTSVVKIVKNTITTTRRNVGKLVNPSKASAMTSLRP